jgi:hypothetical protein
MDGNIFNSQGALVAVVHGSSIFSPRGQSFTISRAPKYISFLGSWLGISQTRELPNSIWTEKKDVDFIFDPDPELATDRCGRR